MSEKSSTMKREPLREWPYESFELLYTDRKGDLKKLKEILGIDKALSLSPHSLLEYLLSPKEGESTPACKSIIVENRYYDKDHSDAFSKFYCKSFRFVKRECIRLHFFSSRIPVDAIFDLEKKAKYYLGFCVVRPFPSRTIGRTVIARLRDKPALEFPTCKGKFSVNIAGSSMTIEGPAFIEQDALVSVCASASIWMSTTTMANRYNLYSSSTSQITINANQQLLSRRAMPSTGLTYEQMMQALDTMNYDPLLIDEPERDEMLHSIYTYVESEVPPILLCNTISGEGHTIVAIGHGYQFPIDNPKMTEAKWLRESSLFFARSSAWVPHYLIHDDQRGIYRKLTPIEPDPELLLSRIRDNYGDIDISNIRLDKWKCPIAIDLPAAGNSQRQEIANIFGVIVPLPGNVILTGKQAESKSARMIRLWHWLSHTSPPDNLVLRTYLIPSNEYKKRIIESDINGFVKAMYRGKPMPKWVWVTEVSSIESYNAPEPEEWLIRGEVIIDATSNPWVPDFIAFHYITDTVSVLVTMKPEHETAEQSFKGGCESKSDKPYPGWIR